ncbi:aldehyde-activating protein [Sphingomonas piscis]|uniref:Aldehyde-activating protein n=2 Tax=Sphingomonas piscis TaxID=2714943 RepID=A0A6G7YTB5_9SPHN|nr:aldehyde-activating protein [Sphingomonas piscis]
MSSSAFSLSSLYPAVQFEQLSGETDIGGLKGGTRHSFCASCLSWLWTVPEGLDDYVNIRSPMLEDASGRRAFLDCWLTEKLPWASSGACKRYDTVPEPHEFEALAAEYAAWDGEVTP